MSKRNFDCKKYLEKYVNLYKSNHSDRETWVLVKKIIRKDSDLLLPEVLDDVSKDDLSSAMSSIIKEKEKKNDRRIIIKKDCIVYEEKKEKKFSLKKIALVGSIVAITLTTAVSISKSQFEKSIGAKDKKIEFSSDSKINTDLVAFKDVNILPDEKKVEKEKNNNKKKEVKHVKENNEEINKNKVLNDFSNYNSVDDILKRQKELESLNLKSSDKLYEDCSLKPAVQRFIYELSALYGYPVDLTFAIIDTETRGKFDSNGEESYNGPGDYDLGLTQQNTIARVTEFCKKFNISYDDAYLLIRDNDYVNLVSAFIEYDEIASHFDSYQPIEYAGCYNGWLNWKNKAISREYVDLFEEAYNEEYTKYHDVIKIKEKRK